MMFLSFFAEMAWKSALVAGAALLLAHALRSRSAADRTLVLRIGVILLLLLPVLALALPSLEIVAFAAPEPLPPVPYSVPELQLAGFGGMSSPALEPTIWDDPTPLVVLAYLGGLAMVGARLVAGLWTLRRWTRAARPVECPEWLAAFDRVRWSADCAEHVRLLVSDEVASPLSWGWRRPIVLIDRDTLDQPDDAEAILAHEVAHVARRDWPVLILARTAATLFWFNPLAWVLEREVVQQAEEAADCEAAARVEPARYAETLVSWAQANAMVPANSIAPSARALGRRVRAVLDRRLRERPSGSAWTALAILSCLGLGAPVAAMQLVAAEPPAPPAALSPPSAPAAPGVMAVPVPPSTLAAPEAPRAPAAPTAPDAPEAPAAPGAHRAFTVVIPEMPDLEPVLAEVPAIVASAMAGIDREEMDRALREAQREMRQAHRVNRRELERAMREARRAQAQARTVSRAEIELAMRGAQRAVRAAPAAAAVSMMHGAAGMEHGAAGMEDGARRMEREAARLEDPDYRERAIARARAHGETVTHEDLVEAAEGLREGAEGMREGAREMREAAERMRREH
ncbi:M56 family metallopeptidase [Sphingosinicella terrae]|uniref:M56 family metallopeptidase n=1 Tax=Sphingosinicella terrae TaxID=2172047 RepID=UPI000E0DD16F|nr:M56 family metallopeptidase [Sphingosinicella terrae]